jgi:hypothetical protein
VHEICGALKAGLAAILTHRRVLQGDGARGAFRYQSLQPRLAKRAVLEMSDEVAIFDIVEQQGGEGTLQ